MATVAELKKQLDALGVEYPSKAKKGKLEDLVREHTSEVPGTPGEEGPTDLPEDSEGPTSVDDAPEPPPARPADAHVREPKKGDLVVQEGQNLLKDGKVYPAGSAAPDLTDAEEERLTRLGVVE